MKQGVCIMQGVCIVGGELARVLRSRVALGSVRMARTRGSFVNPVVAVRRVY